jgi:hypothetical protein
MPQPCLLTTITNIYLPGAWLGDQTPICSAPAAPNRVKESVLKYRATQRRMKGLHFEKEMQS